MVELRLDELAARMNGRILQGDPARVFGRFGIDSRLTVPGELFFAIRARRDGHDFIPEAAARGAGGAVTSRDVPVPRRDFALLRVDSTVEALEQLARTALAGQPVKVVGITGSVGKTTAKEFTASLLSRRFTVLKSEGNFNNNLGLALSVLRLEPGHQAAVLEMGTSGFGEIRALTRIAPPDVAVIININPVHLEFLHDLEGVARAKKEILEGTRETGVAVLNADDPWVREIARDWPGRRLTFGFVPGADVQAASVRRLGQDGMAFELRCGGEKAQVRPAFYYEDYVYNLLAAVGACAALDVPFGVIVEGISGLRPLERRGGLVRLARGIRLIDDSYNSNPRALEAALSGLAALPAARRVAVLGDMLELGEREREYHLAAGRQVVESGWDVLVAVGPLGALIAEGARAAGMEDGGISVFPTAGAAAPGAAALVHEGDLVLVKGSRGIRMEQIADRLTADFKEK
jgi:UDP-N-acetylmuramoyl-tripeptide--D-alanyl-D-alanine ligase